MTNLRLGAGGRPCIPIGRESPPACGDRSAGEWHATQNPCYTGNYSLFFSPKKVSKKRRPRYFGNPDFSKEKREKFETRCAQTTNLSDPFSLRKTGRTRSGGRSKSTTTSKPTSTATQPNFNQHRQFPLTLHNNISIQLYLFN
ncbi:hypothetical protein S2091_4397 [Solimicrobium silvestre]|uniref:Uncharacterized protein n=1 Tax=Solimicrobium silvestre TaxID=2099400 RepID=A0A2S9GT57_9BURK|nr:hypothetical protein S2091_4397 [Solimicrobium silvestre]